MILEAIVGGAAIGVAAVWMYLAIGRIAGISGIFAQAVRAPLANRWALVFLLGLGAGGWLAQAFARHEVQPLQLDPMWFALGGLIVGFGTRLGSGCTSGHGVCGISRFSVRSVVATITFVAVGMLVGTTLHGVMR